MYGAKNCINVHVQKKERKCKKLRILLRICAKMMPNCAKRSLRLRNSTKERQSLLLCTTTYLLVVVRRPMMSSSPCTFYVTITIVVERVVDETPTFGLGLGGRRRDVDLIFMKENSLCSRCHVLYNGRCGGGWRLGHLYAPIFFL